MNYIGKFYLDKEKDIIVNLYKENADELIYIIRTPNHHTGNLITNLAKVCGLETIKDENDMKIIKGTIPAYIIGNSNKDIYILRFKDIEVATIYDDGIINQRVQIPAIIKTFMSQTKNYNIDLNKTLVSAYIPKKFKFKTDLHTHQNANLSPDCLIALGIKHQVRYPLYYIKKINLKLSKEQEDKIFKQRAFVESQFTDSPLTGKYLTRKIDDNTFINFADLILNNLENAEENISKIRSSLSILKDGQAVFTNLEKVYLYRYVFAKGTISDNKINLDIEKIRQIPETDIKLILLKMLKDTDPNSPFANNSLRDDKLLWVAREYQKQGIEYVEITDTDFAVIDRGINKLNEVHKIMPYIEKETNVKLRFLVGIRRIPLTIIKDQIADNNYLRENLDVLKTVAKSPYIVGSDFIGEEINDISELQPVVNELVQYAVEEDDGFTIRIHAGENDSIKNNVGKSIECVTRALKPGQKMPRIRIGHGLYGVDLNSKEGLDLIKLIKDTNTTIEFQLTSNVRLNNLSDLSNHPIKTYLKNDIRCLQGTDGCGFYGSDTIDEQLSLKNLLELNEEEFNKMRHVEDNLLVDNDKYFKEKSKKFEKFLNNRNLLDALKKLQTENLEKGKTSKIELRLGSYLDSETEFKNMIKDLPMDKMPIIVAGGSFNSQDTTIKTDKKLVKDLEQLMEVLDQNKCYFIIGHSIEGYENEVVKINNHLNHKFEIFSIVPKVVTEQQKNSICNNNLDGIRISIEPTPFGIYKSFNFEIFERRTSIVIAFGGNSPVLNLVQEAKNGKGKSKIYVNGNVEALRKKAEFLEGYVHIFYNNNTLTDKILNDNEDIKTQ